MNTKEKQEPKRKEAEQKKVTQFSIEEKARIKREVRLLRGMNKGKTMPLEDLLRTDGQIS